MDFEVQFDGVFRNIIMMLYLLCTRQVVTSQIVIATCLLTLLVRAVHLTAESVPPRDNLDLPLLPNS